VFANRHVRHVGRQSYLDLVLIIQEAASSDSVPTWIGAIATAAAVIVAIVAITLTYMQIRITTKQIRDAADREAENSEAQTRPYIGLDVVPGLAGHSSFDLLITNFGRTTARNIRIDLIDDEFKAQSNGDEIGPALGRLFAALFDLAPSARRRVLWYLPEQSNAEPGGPIGTPIKGEIRATYEWQRSGEQAPVRQYEDLLSYDLTEYPKLIPLPSTGATAEGMAGSPEVIARNQVHALRSISRHIAEMGR